MGLAVRDVVIGVRLWVEQELAIQAVLSSGTRLTMPGGVVPLQKGEVTVRVRFDDLLRCCRLPRPRVSAWDRLVGRERWA